MASSTEQHQLPINLCTEANLAFRAPHSYNHFIPKITPINQLYRPLNVTHSLSSCHTAPLFSSQRYIGEFDSWRHPPPNSATLLLWAIILHSCNPQPLMPLPWDLHDLRTLGQQNKQVHSINSFPKSKLFANIQSLVLPLISVPSILVPPSFAC